MGNQASSSRDRTWGDVRASSTTVGTSLLDGPVLKQPNKLRTPFIVDSVAVKEKGGAAELNIVYSSDLDGLLKITIGGKQNYQTTVSKGEKQVGLTLPFDLESFTSSSIMDTSPLIVDFQANFKHEISAVSNSFSVFSNGVLDPKLVKRTVRIGEQVFVVKNAFTEEADSECVVCLSLPPNTIIIPCLHLCLCLKCAVELKRSFSPCPLCRGSINEFWVMKEAE